MKKLMLVVIAFTLFNCQVKVDTQQANANPYQTYNITEIVGSCNGKAYLDVTVYNRDGIEYRVFTSQGHSGSAVFVVNHTRELLEIQLLNQQLKQ